MIRRCHRSRPDHKRPSVLSAKGRDRLALAVLVVEAVGVPAEAVAEVALDRQIRRAQRAEVSDERAGGESARATNTHSVRTAPRSVRSRSWNLAAAQNSGRPSPSLERFKLEALPQLR
jgi:hypothetical protein